MSMNPRDWVDQFYEWHLENQCTHIPRHIALIQDGNRRYAKEKGIDVAVGHRLGAMTTEKMLDWVHELGIEHITLYSFSTENFNRSEEELSELFLLFKEKFLKVATDERVHKYGIRVQMIGDRSLIPPDILATIDEAEAATKDYSNFYMNIAIAYGGRNEIVLAIKSVLEEVEAGTLTPDAIDVEAISRHLHEGMELPPVDLIIRTGNERRTSNFLPWIANGNESAVYFCAPYWPGFRKIDLLRGIRLFDQRIKAAERSGAVPV